MDPATFRLLKSEVKDLTPEIAQSFHELAPSPTERELNTGRLKMLREKAANNQLITFQWAKALLENKWIRVNGQHSSQMLVELDGSFPTGLKVHIDEYEVADLQGLGLLFRQFDDKKSGRSSADVAGAYQNLEPALQEVPRDIGKLAVEGVTFYRQQIAKAPTPGGDNQYTLFHEFALHDFIKWAGDIFSIKTPEMRMRPVVAAMYASFLANPVEARHFWDGVSRGGDQYTENSAASVLDAWLTLMNTRETRQENKVRPVQAYQGCIYAYNAYLRGQPLKGIKYEFKTMLEPIPKAA